MVKVINYSLITALPVATSADPQTSFYPQPCKMIADHHMVKDNGLTTSCSVGQMMGPFYLTWLNLLHAVTNVAALGGKIH